ncbi:hypothetical protein DFH09DRAFT_976477 [Mycena vulgaris]|nr:hypothetical protein DFH09DRAFT_976477 [Mycena vulgaris]
MVYSQEWRHVELRLPIDSFLDLAAYSGPFPLLRSLSLSIYTRHMFDHEQTITIRGAPLLRKVTLTDFPFLTSDISWEQLTILKVTTHNTALAISALQRCSNLVDLEFSSGVLGRPPPLTIPPFTLPSLQSLSMTGRSILRFLTLPSLEQLNMHGSSGVMWSFTESLLALLQRSACPLKRLSFRVPPDITTNAFRTFLLAAAPIVELKLMFGNMGTSALPLIAVFQTAELLPGLTALHISALRITDVANTTTFRHLLDMLRARRTPVAGRALLQSFSLSLGLLSARFWAAPTSAPPQGVIAEFNALADDGLRIRIANDTVLMDR